MNSDELTSTQAEQMRDVLIPFVRYLHRMQSRMERRGFPSDDPLYRSTVETYGAAQTLCMKLHYLSCTSGVSRPAKGPGSGKIPGP